MRNERHKNVYLSWFWKFYKYRQRFKYWSLPKELSGRITPVGNAAGAGTIYALLSEDN